VNLSCPFHYLLQVVKKSVAKSLAYGATDVDVVGVDGPFPSTVQSETYTTANPDDPTQVMVAYNDSTTSAQQLLRGIILD